ncbi:hypothetical protein FC756_19790 [Lysinibacillus mangiferihumi]|uniref:Transposase n=1 Tax=Lysinibacillus mangiferihumi TaxID=1130819 RepID=A0A4U2YGD4_9BACI|nr:hypothetical protein [Lysinibacillus mangiferihumi]TKI60067.1 hypothetical protein FC756_19790 [Lysinibacillus mangiferihumi]
MRSANAFSYLVGARFERRSLRNATDVTPAQGLKSVDYSTLSKRLGEIVEKLEDKRVILVADRAYF